MGETTDQQKNSELIRLLQSKSDTPNTNCNPGDYKWTAEETSCLLTLITEYDYLSQIKSQNCQVYSKLCKLMKIRGHSKAGEDIQKYWKFLMQKYNDYKTGNSDEFKYFQQVSGLLTSNSSESEPEIIIIKGEELDNNILTSSDSLENNFYDDHDYEQKNGKGVRRNNWTHKETECVLKVLEKYGMPSRTSLRKFCYIITEYLKQKGFSRSEEQAQIKIKHLRAMYNRVVRKTVKEDEFPFFKRMELLMQAQQDLKIKENEETHNYTMLDEPSKSDSEENCTTNMNETITDEEDAYYKKSRQIWTNKEIHVLLKFIEENNIITGKQLRIVCDKAVNYLASYGYDRSPSQILIRWKNTKAQYWATFRKRSKFPGREYNFFYRLHVILNPGDSTYSTTKNLNAPVIDDDNDDDEEELNFYQNSENPKNDDSKVRVNNFHFKEINSLQKNNLMTSKYNNINSDNSQGNVHSSKRFHVQDMPGNSLENSDSFITNPSSPKRSRTESIMHSNCSFCNTLDPIDHYCISLADSIKKLDARKQAKLKIEIQQLMYKAEFDSNF